MQLKYVIIILFYLLGETGSGHIRHLGFERYDWHR
jgi:hypothetical protein